MYSFFSVYNEIIEPQWSRHDETNTIKPIIKEVFVASSGDTDYNYLFCLFTHASRLVNIMFAFVIGETTNNQDYSTQLKTHVE